MVAATTAYRTQNAKMGCYQSGPTYRKEPRNSAISRCFWAFNYIYACIKDCVLIDPRTQNAKMGCYQSGPTYRKEPRNSAISRCFWAFNYIYACIKDCVLIDPPYNTGNDFVYEDDFADPLARYKEVTQQTTKSNPETMGRFHTNWLNMMYPRLRLAANLLRDDGVIFISIDDNEVTNLRKICDEVFGEENFVAQLIWERAYSPKNDAKYISNSHDYVLMYAKYIDKFVIGRLPRTEEANARYQNPDNDPRGVWKPGDLSVKTYNADCDYPITTPSGRIVEPPTGRCWRQSKESFQKSVEDNRIWFGIDGNSVPQVKRFLSELKFEGMAPQSLMFYKQVGHSQEGAKEVTSLLEAGVFDGPKPTRLLNRLITLANTDKDSIILDFFSGSATTAHAVMQLNAEDGGNRQFIMVQLPEVCDEKSMAEYAPAKLIISRESFVDDTAMANAHYILKDHGVELKLV